MSWTLKKEHIYSGKNKVKDTQEEHTYTSERTGTKDEGLGDILESYT